MKCKECGWFRPRGVLKGTGVYVDLEGIRTKRSKAEDILGYCDAKSKDGYKELIMEYDIQNKNRCTLYNSKEYVEELRFSNKSW